MSARKKSIVVVLAILAMVVGGGIWWAAGRSGPEQLIALPNGDKFRFVGTTYGTDTAPPSMIAKVIHRLPDSSVEFLQKPLGQRIGDLIYYDETFDRPRLLVWFRHIATNGMAATGESPSRSWMAALN